MRTPQVARGLVAERASRVARPGQFGALGILGSLRATFWATRPEAGLPGRRHSLRLGSPASSKGGPVRALKCSSLPDAHAPPPTHARANPRDITSPACRVCVPLHPARVPNCRAIMATSVGDDDVDDLDDEQALVALVSGGCAVVNEPAPPQDAAAAPPVAWAKLMATRTQNMDVVEARRILRRQPTFDGKDACDSRTLKITIELENLAEDQEEFFRMMSAVSDKDGDGNFVDEGFRRRCVRGRMHMSKLATARMRYLEGPPPPPAAAPSKPVIEKGDPLFSGARGRARAAALVRSHEVNCRIHANLVTKHKRKVADHDNEMEVLRKKAMQAIAYLGLHFPRRGTYAALKARWLARARELAGGGEQTATRASASPVRAQLWAEEERRANKMGMEKQEKLAKQRGERGAIADAEREEVEELQATVKRECGTIEGWRAGVSLAIATCRRWKRTLKRKSALPEREASATRTKFYDLLHPKTPKVAAERDTAWIDEWGADVEVFAGGAADSPVTVMMVPSSAASSSEAWSLAKRAKP